MKGYPYIVNNTVQSITKQFDEQLERLAADIHRDIIIPFCDKFNYKFSPHVGVDETWAFYNEIGVMVDQSLIPADIILTLNIRLQYFKGHQNRLGQYVKPYHPRGFVPTY